MALRRWCSHEVFVCCFFSLGCLDNFVWMGCWLSHEDILITLFSDFCVRYGCVLYMQLLQKLMLYIYIAIIQPYHLHQVLDLTLHLDIKRRNLTGERRTRCGGRSMDRLFCSHLIDVFFMAKAFRKIINNTYNSKFLGLHVIIHTHSIS